MNGKSVNRVCINCEKSFRVGLSLLKKGGGKYCSRKCKHSHKRGKNHPNYGMVLPEATREKIRIANRTGKFYECFVCGKSTYKRPSRIKRVDRPFCSRVCAYKGKRGKPKKGKLVECKSCGGKIYRMESQLYGTSKRNKLDRYFCSRDCRKGVDEGGKVTLRCNLCGKDYITFKAQVKHRGSRFCSYDCFHKYKRKNFIARKKIKKRKNSVLKRQLWLYFSKYIRQRDDGICISCGKQNDWRKMDAGHYVPKTAGLELYFDEQNVNCQCTYCNRWMHGNLSKYALALRIKYGDDILEKLDEKRKTIRSIPNNEYVHLIEEYKEKLSKNNFDFK